ncbi:Ribonuclease P protein subunit p29 [Aphelenchoides fujianensis]|nr:Ribonuclease P protein subunit p29 [Aphelenchoides fujianensis]
MGEPSTNKKNFFVHLEKTAKTRRGKPKEDLLNVVRRAAGGKAAFKEFKYAELLDLYKLWCGYFQDVVELMTGPADPRLLKADFHGCLLRVAQAANPSQIGLHGIVVHESRNTFQMVTKKDKIIVIPKEGSTFQFVLAGKVYTIFGDAIRQKSFLRGRRMKSRTEVPFLLK